MLAQKYLRNSAPVAFVDESYRAAERDRELPFYTMTAFVVESSLLDQTRNDLLDIVDADYWHTTEAYEAYEIDKISQMLAYIANSDCTSIVAIQVDVLDNDLELARRECMAALMNAVCEAGVKLVVLERRRAQPERNSDEALVKRLINAGRIPRVEMVQATPYAEELLWAPDAVGWAMRRDLARNDTDWFDIIEERVAVINACDGFRINTKRPDHAAAVDSGPDRSAVREDRETRRSSGPSVTPPRPATQRIAHFASQVSASIQSDGYLEVRRWIMTEFPRQ